MSKPMMYELTRLADQLWNVQGPSDALDAELARVLEAPFAAYTSDAGAAAALAPPSWNLTVDRGWASVGPNEFDRYGGNGPNPAIAICLAVVRATIATTPRMGVSEDGEN